MRERKTSFLCLKEINEKTFAQEWVYYLLNKNDNSHKNEALKWQDKRTLTLVEGQNRISRILMHKSQ